MATQKRDSVLETAKRWQLGAVLLERQARLMKKAAQRLKEGKIQIKKDEHGREVVVRGRLWRKKRALVGGFQPAD